ncbi:MAG: prepilin-type N-terminal cleavage/methylation domain-containing protein [Xanthomonadales bacterium]|nr:prepilin-type N-terminal cleavage/methylation domain-containing protein [Xanthomonadales bacterium]
MSRRTHRRLPRSARAASGFTLIEILIATILLAAAMTLGFATLRAASAAATRGEITAQRNERMRAVEGFLRRRIASALPIAFDVNESTGSPLRFLGEPDRIRFVADLPAYLGRGGPHLHDITVVDDGEGVRLQADFAVVLANEVNAERDPRPPELLAGGLREVKIRYRALDAQNRIGDWEEVWSQGDRMPLQVKIEIIDGRGDRWPPIVVSLPQAASFGGFSQVPI